MPPAIPITLADQGFLRIAQTSVETLPIKAAMANKAFGSRTSTFGLQMNRSEATPRPTVPYLFPICNR